MKKSVLHLYLLLLPVLASGMESQNKDNWLPQSSNASVSTNDSYKEMRPVKSDDSNPSFISSSPLISDPVSKEEQIAQLKNQYNEKTSKDLQLIIEQKEIIDAQERVIDEQKRMINGQRVEIEASTDLLEEYAERIAYYDMLMDGRLNFTE